jgi:uncharacterized membrane protein
VLDPLTLFMVLAVLYFIPTVVAFNRQHHQRNTITVINVFLGWTFIGWVVALAMAVSATRD